MVSSVHCKVRRKKSYDQATGREPTPQWSRHDEYLYREAGRLLIPGPVGGANGSEQEI
jgi:hypothetical protein